MAKKTGRILVVDDNLGIRKTLGLILPQFFEAVLTLPSPTDLPGKVNEFNPDVILLDMNFKSTINNGNEGLFWLKEIKSRYPDVEVILFTAYGDIQLAVEGMKCGALDFIVKPWENSTLINTLREGVEKSKSQKGKTESETEIFWGDSESMNNLRNVISKIADTDIPVLITGENGTGKDLVASELHKCSKRSSHPFVGVDMGAIPETLFESDLFGHVKGAFTGAVADVRGKFEKAADGTLFLDEIGNLSLPLQAKLLRALQKRVITRVGSDKEIPLKSRFICATNKNLKNEIEKGNFREDLYYRVAGFHIHIPSLRERKQDILPLARHFLTLFNQCYKKNIEDFDLETEKFLLNNPWRGNVRELKNVIEKAVILAESSLIHMDSIVMDGINHSILTEESAGEKERIAEILSKTGHNISASAKLLNISRPTLYSKIAKYNL